MQKQELCVLCIKEKTDYRSGEILIRRKDGVKLLYNNDGLQCLYPDGTKITTQIYIEDVQEFLGSNSSGKWFDALLVLLLFRYVKSF